MDRLLEDGGAPDFAADMTVIHLPGHCSGQIALLWKRDGGILFPADACVNIRGLKLPVGTEDPQLALNSLTKLATFDFDKICFMHGPPIMAGGGERFRKTTFDTFKN